MTRKERALKNLKQMCSDGRYLGSGSYAPLEVLEDFKMAIKALEQEPILDKIRAEIEQIKEAEYQIYGKGSWRFVDKCLDVIDKYKAESEEV